MDNSANMHVLRDKYLFVSDIKPTPLGADVGTVVGSNKPQGIGLAETQWHDDDHVLRKETLHDALCFPDSPVNVISVSKLGLDNDDGTCNTQTYPTYSILTWNQRRNTMTFQHSASNLPELALVNHFSPLQCLATALKAAKAQLSKEDELQLFQHVSSKDLHALQC